MSLVRVFQIPVEGGQKIVYIPELLKIYLVSRETEIPDQLEVPAHAAPVFRKPEQRFRRCDLILNNFCNLRCVYCYSEAGTCTRREMQPEVARRAVDQVAAVCQELGETRFSVTLTGGGEPLLSLRLVRHIVEYCKKKSVEIGLSCKLAIVSNGTFSPRVCDYVIENFSNISISIDGQAEIHDRQRPTSNGKGSFQRLEKNIDRLLASGKIGVGFRMTVTALSVETMQEQVLFLHHRWPGVLIGIEPVERTGRCATSDAIAPDPMKFATHFVRTMRVAKENGIQVRHSAATIKALPCSISFCGINGRIFGVDPEGNVTGCTRVNSREDPLSSQFHYGSFDPESNSFVIDEPAYRRLEKLVVDSVPECTDCFARNSCKGDCCHLKAGVDGENFAHRRSPRCHANRAMTLGLFRLQLGLPEVPAQDAP